MKLIRCFFTAFFLMFTSLSSAGGVISVADNGQLYKDGYPFRAIGVNYYDAFSDAAFGSKINRYKHGFIVLKRYNVPFARVMLGAYWPSEFELYLKNKKKYFAIMDAVLAEAEKNGVGIIACLNWNFPVFSDLVSEPVSYWGRRDSSTTKLFNKYVTDMLNRYKDRSVIWAWEFSNEMSLYADLPNAEEFRPEINKNKGTPLFRTPADDLSRNDLSVAYESFLKLIKSKDGSVLLSTGNALPRAYAYHNYISSSWSVDTAEEFCEILKIDNPSDFKLMSIHFYPKRINGYDGLGFSDYFGMPFVSASEMLDRVTSCASKSNQPVFVGEFGISSSKNTIEEKANFQYLLDVIVKSNVSLASVWVFDFPYQSTTFNISNDSYRRYQLQMIQEANAQLKKY